MLRSREPESGDAGAVVVRDGDELVVLGAWTATISVESSERVRAEPVQRRVAALLQHGALLLVKVSPVLRSPS